MQLAVISKRHWSELSPEEQVRFWQDYEAGIESSFLVLQENKGGTTKRRRGEHSTKPKCENPAWFRPDNYKALGGQLGHAYNRLVKRPGHWSEHTQNAHVVASILCTETSECRSQI